MSSFLDKQTIILLLGRTGDGKSTFGNLFIQHCEELIEIPNIFHENDSAYSATSEPQEFISTNAKYQIIDNPGLIDTSGLQQDEENLRKIVLFAQSKSIVSVFLLIMNQQLPRFDESMKQAFQLLYESFGPGLISNLGIVFTKSYLRQPDKTLSYVQNELIPIFQMITNLSISHIPHWEVESHPQHFQSSFTEEYIQTLEHRNKQAIDEIFHWAHAAVSYDTTVAVYREYEITRRRKEIEQQALLQQRLTFRQFVEFEKRFTNDLQNCINELVALRNRYQHHQERTTNLINAVTEIVGRRNGRYTIDTETVADSSVGLLLTQFKAQNQQDIQELNRLVEEARQPRHHHHDGHHHHHHQHHHHRGGGRRGGGGWENRKAEKKAILDKIDAVKNAIALHSQ